MVSGRYSKEGMASIPLSHRDELIASLHETARQTEDIFMVLAGSLPSLVSEMNRSLERSEHALECVGGLAGCADGAEISDLLQQTRSAMTAGINRFREMHDEDGKLFAELQSGVEQLHGISASIDKIKLDSEDMELVSLNAMTVALKAGNAGRAFSYITEELKRLANRTITLAESISERGTHLLEAFHELEGVLNDAREFETHLISSFEDRIFASFDDFQSTVEATVDGLRTLHHESRDLKDPVNGMMEAIQLQDLIRQSIDHIVLALEAIRPENELDDAEDLLDELAFIRQIPDLAVSLIEDVAGQIDRSVETFFHLIDQAETRRSELETSRSSFIDSSMTGGDLDQRFSKASELIRELLGDLQRSMQKKQTLVSRSSGIIGDVSGLDDQFRQFSTYVNRFKSIDIASRIEVAKQEVLRTMGSSSNEMNSLTRKIEHDVSSSLEATEEFIKTTSKVISDHQRDFHEQHAYAEQFGTTIRQHYSELESSRDQVVNVVQDFALFTDGFHRVFDETKANGGRLSRLSSSLRELTGTLQKLREAIEERYQRELSERGLESWTIGNDRLQEIIQRFTIFDHKQRAGSIAGFDVDEGVESGEVTLF